MIDKYSEIFDRYKEFIESNSQYKARVVKTNTNTSSYFPLITCVLSNNISTDVCTLDKIEYFEEHFYTIDIYTKNEIIDGNIVASQIVSNELTKLTIKFFEKLNMKRTLCSPTPNLDKDIYRVTIQFQGMIGNVRGNIIRR